MAHFAQIDENNIVQQVIVVDNENTHNSNGVEDEAVGVAFCQSILGVNTNWVQTSYNGNMRGKYAGIGDIYDENNDEFYTPVSNVVNVDSTVNKQSAIEVAEATKEVK